jgi:hypothetical protein
METFGAGIWCREQSLPDWRMTGDTWCTHWVPTPLSYSCYLLPVAASSCGVCQMRNFKQISSYTQIPQYKMRCLYFTQETKALFSLQSNWRYFSGIISELNSVDLWLTNYAGVGVHMCPINFHALFIHCVLQLEFCSYQNDPIHLKSICHFQRLWFYNILY